MGRSIIGPLPFRGSADDAGDCATTAVNAGLDSVFPCSTASGAVLYCVGILAVRRDAQ
jgi:hypothetical protein